MPLGLAALWKAHEEGDGFLADTLGITLLKSLRPLEAGYGEAIAEGNADILANVRAHQRVFQRLGFFAEAEDGEFLANDFQTGPADDPPVVRLDSEGQYDWKGANLAEALYRVAEDKGVPEESKDWLVAHDLKLGALGTFGSTTQFLPSIQDWHSEVYCELQGAPHAKIASSSDVATPNDPESWLLRPGSEVRSALLTLLKLSPNAAPKEQWVECDGEGRVKTIWLRRVKETSQIAFRGVKFGMHEKDVGALLGDPERTGNDWVKFAFENRRLRIGVKNGVVASMDFFIKR